MNARKRHEIFSRLREALPEPRGELVYSSPFELLVSVILSAQSTDASVNKVTAQLFSVANTPQAILALGEERLKSHIRTLGFYNAKARNILATSRILMESHGGQVPKDRAALESLPGVGRKTANVILNTVYRRATIAVDTHVFRVANRTRIAPGRNVVEVEKRLIRCVPREFKLHAHHWLILHGRYTCVARRPKCPACIINDLCEYPDKTPAELARTAESTKPTGSGRRR